MDSFLEMEVNHADQYASSVRCSVNATGCCFKFNPDGRDGQSLHFENKPIVKVATSSVAHVPLNMGKVFGRVPGHPDSAGAVDPNQQIVLSHDISSWKAEHLFAVTGPVQGEEMTSLSGDIVAIWIRGIWGHRGCAGTDHCVSMSLTAVGQ